MDESSEPQKINIAYIDAANLDWSLKSTLKWHMDYAKFRIWLDDKYNVKRAHIFIGLIPKHRDLYNHLQNCGFSLIFKEVIYSKGKTKGNCDSDLLMQAANDLYEGDLDKAIIVSSDGDYTPLVKTLMTKGKLQTILSPSPANKCSILLKRTGAPIAYINDQRSILEQV